MACRVQERGMLRVAGGGPSALAGRTGDVPALDAYGRYFQVELTIARVDEAPTRFRGTIAVVGSHSATAAGVRRGVQRLDRARLRERAGGTSTAARCGAAP
jgi:hypothetical protein